MQSDAEVPYLTIDLAERIPVLQASRWLLSLAVAHKVHWYEGICADRATGSQQCC